jgi:hypothetical protein
LLGGHTAPPTKCQEGAYSESDEHRTHNPLTLCGGSNPRVRFE